MSGVPSEVVCCLGTADEGARLLIWRQTLQSTGEEGGHYRHTTGMGITANPDWEFSAWTKERLYCIALGWVWGHLRGV